jgi:hypothetical protein
MFHLALCAARVLSGDRSPSVQRANRWFSDGPTQPKQHLDLSIVNASRQKPDQVIQ